MANSLELKQAYEQADANCKVLAAKVEGTINYDDLLGENAESDVLFGQLSDLLQQRQQAFDAWQNAVAKETVPSYFESENWDA